MDGDRSREQGSLEVEPPAGPKTAPTRERETDAIYQRDRVVARVLDAEVNLEAKEIRFGEVYSSDELILPDECEYQIYKIYVQKIATAYRGDRELRHKGRILKEVIAEILGYREQ